MESKDFSSENILNANSNILSVNDIPEYFIGAY